MKCKSCSAPLPKSGTICDYCKHNNPLNLYLLEFKEVPLAKRDNTFLECPKCSNRLIYLNIGRKRDTIILYCQKCDGLFISHEALENTLEEYIGEKKRQNNHKLSFILNHPRQNRLSKNEKITYLNCIYCQDIMQRKNYHSNSGVILHQCIKHGFWIEAGALLQLLEWKYLGGDKKPQYKEYLSLKYLNEKERQEASDFINQFNLKGQNQ